MGEQLHILNQFYAGCSPALNSEGEDCALALRQIFLRKLIGRMARQAGIAHPLYILMTFQVLRHFERIRAMAFQAQMQGFQPLQQQPGVKW
ncbi:hypothetical protein D3C75_1192400 [compost metagenome]